MPSEIPKSNEDKAAKLAGALSQLVVDVDRVSDGDALEFIRDQLEAIMIDLDDRIEQYEE